MQNFDIFGTEFAFSECGISIFGAWNSGGSVFSSNEHTQHLESVYWELGGPCFVFSSLLAICAIGLIAIIIQQSSTVDLLTSSLYMSYAGCFDLFCQLARKSHRFL